MGTFLAFMINCEVTPAIADSVAIASAAQKPQKLSAIEPEADGLICQNSGSGVSVSSCL